MWKKGLEPRSKKFAFTELTLKEQFRRGGQWVLGEAFQSAPLGGHSDMGMKRPLWSVKGSDYERKKKSCLSKLNETNNTSVFLCTEVVYIVLVFIEVVHHVVQTPPQSCI